jgi:hypothetical protein
MMTTNCIANSVCPNHKSASGTQHVAAKFESRREQSERQPRRDADDVADQKPAHRDQRRLQKRFVFHSAPQVACHFARQRREHG